MRTIAHVLSIDAVLAIACLVACGLVACGTKPPPHVPEGPLNVVPATHAPKLAPPPAPARPDGVALWVHIDDPDAILDILGVSLAGGGGFSRHELAPIDETVDLRQPLDVVLVATTGKRRDVEPIVRVHFKDSKAFLHLIGKELKLREDGDRVRARRRHDSSGSGDPDEEKDDETAEDIFVCDFTRSSDVAVCGPPKAVDKAGEWLRTAPVPGEDTARGAKVQPLARAVAYGDAIRRATAELRAERSNRDGELEAIFGLLEDSDHLELDLVREDGMLAFSGKLQLKSSSSKFVNELITPTGSDAPNEAFYRLWQDTSASFYTPGGGPVPKWVTDMFAPSRHEVSQLPQGIKDKNTAAGKILGKAFEKPVAIGYGVRTDRVKSALAAARSAKDPEKALHALQEAMEPYFAVATSIDLAEAERGVRDAIAYFNGEAAEREKQSKSKYPSTKYAFRFAPAKLALPRGSFFVYETKVDWVRASGMTGNAAPPTRTDSTVFFTGGQHTWAIGGPDEKACVDSAKKILAPSTAKEEPNALFKRPGVVVSGYFSSQLGAFTMHRIGDASMSGGSIPTDVLLDIEHDLTVKRVPLPFVFTTTKRAAGGDVAFEVRGEKDAVKVIGKHLGLGGNIGSNLIYMLLHNIR